ncbi:MarR family winged helix-turn-helix transcriptional regulator [Nocardia alni]|uniref:MarR family winged helix-turn-helix transcriptional regulator n=1 Tax=Nocardia alni TaxID=2815723 RepID=UPI0027DF3B2F|nr:MarR family transcriptional regulator [Nocardia alni]
MTTDDKDGIEELARAADALFLAMRQARSSVLSPDQLSISQQALLEPLLDEAALPVGVLASAAGVSVPTATRMLKQLEVKGMLTRTRAAQDERRVLVELTTLGRQQVMGMRTLRRDAQTRGLAEFAPEERREFAAQMLKLARIIKDSALH